MVSSTAMYHEQFNMPFVCTWLNNFIRPIVGTLTGTTTLGQSETGSNGNEEVLHISQSSRTGASTSDVLISYPGHLRVSGREGVFPLGRNTVRVFYRS